MLFLSIAVSLTWEHLDSLRLAKTFPHTLNFMYGMLAVGVLPLIRKLLGIARDDPREAQVDDVSAWIAAAVIPAIISIQTYLALRTGFAQDLAGVISVSLVLLSVVILFKCASIRRFLNDEQQEHREYRGIPSVHQRFAWALDLLTWIVLSLAITLALWVLWQIPFMDQIELSAPWIWTIVFALNYALYIMSQVLSGYTVGQSVLHVRVVSTVNGLKPAYWIILLRSTIPVIPIFVLILLQLCDYGQRPGDGDGPLDFVYTASAGTVLVILIVGILSLGFVREAHARGQGLLDLMFLTASIDERYPV